VSILSNEELIPMTQTPALLEPSFRDAVAIIAGAQELPEQTRRHWATSLRQIAKALDKPPEEHTGNRFPDDRASLHAMNSLTEQSQDREGDLHQISDNVLSIADEVIE
jgi:hypothetical protein